MILLLDNFDSFTYNLLHYVEQLTSVPVIVKRNDSLTVQEAMKYDSIILSPGPGLPKDAGIMNELIRTAGHDIPVLGVCLGHQAIGEVHGAKMENLKKVLHGVTRTVEVIESDDRLFKEIPSKFKSGHYHSWVISSEDFPEDLKVSAVDEDATIMALSHKTKPISGIQFHPESILTEHGLKIISNWLKFCGHQK